MIGKSVVPLPLDIYAPESNITLEINYEGKGLYSLIYIAPFRATIPIGNVTGTRGYYIGSESFNPKKRNEVKFISHY